MSNDADMADAPPAPTAAAPLAEQILDAASRRFRRFGPRKTTMAEVAREAGCSRATLYAHFPGKRAVYSGLLARETEEFLAELESVVASRTSAAHKLRDVMEATVRIYAQRPLLVGAVAGDEDMALDSIAGPLVEAHQRRVVGMLASVLREGVAGGTFRAIDADAVAYLMFELGQQLVVREVAGRADFSLDRILAVMNDLMAFGLSAAPTVEGGR